MQYSKRGNVYRVARTTGPTHNLLGLEFSVGKAATPIAVEVLGATPDKPRLHVSAVCNAVSEGVQRANVRLGCDWSVVRIQYVCDDSPNAETYAMLAESIVERLESGLGFGDAD